MAGEIIRGLPIAEYHAHPAISNSKLGILRDDGPEAFWLEMQGMRPKLDATDAQEEGSLLDALITREGIDKFMCAPEGHKGNTKEGKALVAKAEEEGKTLMPAADFAWAHGAYEALMMIPDARAAIESGEFQMTLRGRLTSFPAFEIQARPDIAVLDGLACSDFRPLFPDIKKAGKGIKHFMERSILDYGYHKQAAIVRMAAQECGITDTAHKWLVVTKPKRPPVQAVVLNVSEEWLALGMREVIDDLSKIERWAASGAWPRSEQTVMDALPPEWLTRREAYREQEEAMEAAAEAA